ncbi:hypothetical protein LCGC14_2720390, partial [marine sediment metagenome]
LQFGTNDNTQMTILGNGDVGIGTVSPQNKLNVVGDGNFTGNLTIGDDIFMSEDGIIGISASTERIVFDGTGGDISLLGANVGIGTIIPSFILDVFGSMRTTDTYVFSDGSTQAIASTPPGFSWKIGSALFSKSFDVNSEDGLPQDVFFRPDGKKMYVLGSQADEVNEYDLSIPWNVSNSSFLQVLDITTEEIAPGGIYFRPDGKKMYVLGGEHDEINEYNLSTNWDISTALPHQVFDITTEETAPQGIFFKPDGTKFYVIGGQNTEINEYDLSSPWNIVSASFNQLINIVDQDALPTGIFFRPNGEKMYITGTLNDDVYEYDLGFIILGKVGIGTNNPRQLLDLSGGGLKITGTNDAPTSANATYIDQFLGIFRLFSHGKDISTKGEFQFIISNIDRSEVIEALFIQNDGNIGFGTTSPDGKLSIQNVG